MTAASEAIGRSPGIIWITALAIAALGTGLLYDALPGANWSVWTAAAAACLLLFCRLKSGLRSPVFAAGAVAAVIAGGAAVTANPFMLVLIVVGVVACLSMQMLLAASPDWSRIRAAVAIPAPVVAFAQALVESGRRTIEAMHLVQSDRARSIIGGIAITLPVMVIFALLLSSADPLFAEWRDTVENLISNWDFVPRTIFFLALLSIVLGAYGVAARGSSGINMQGDSTAGAARQWLGATQRIILISSVTALFSLFLLVQISYLFGNLPRVTGSGITFAEYARRGFAELTIVASASALLIIVSEKFGRSDHRKGLIRAITIALITAILFLLGSAFHRVSLYEEAYGFTTARLYAQAYMIVVAIGFLALTAEVIGTIDTARLFRRAAAVATAALIALIYWNHEGWIADRNIDRFASTGKLDVKYLVRDLSPDAVPTIVKRMAALPEPAASEIRAILTRTYAGGQQRLDSEWYEWNRGRANAAAALRGAGIPVGDRRAVRPKAYP